MLNDLKKKSLEHRVIFFLIGHNQENCDPRLEYVRLEAGLWLNPKLEGLVLKWLYIKIIIPLSWWEYVKYKDVWGPHIFSFLKEAPCDGKHSKAFCKVQGGRKLR